MSIAIERPQPADELITDEKQAGGIAGEELAELLHRGIVHDGAGTGASVAADAEGGMIVAGKSICEQPSASAAHR